MISMLLPRQQSGVVLEFYAFGVKQLRACIFPALFFAALLITKYISVPGIARYDLILMAALLIQAGLLLTGIETKKELLVLCAFHVIGLLLELFKTHPAIGSWAYPEAGFFKIGTVPLYSGFMYAAVASYMCQSWRLLQLDLGCYPSYWLSVPLCITIYLNFFTHHYIPDFRWLLLAAVVVVFWHTRVRFTVLQKRRSMPLILSFVLIGFFIWLAENISTYLGAWVYPSQQQVWKMVTFGKISSWFLLVIISFLIVANLKFVQQRKKKIQQDANYTVFQNT